MTKAEQEARDRHEGFEKDMAKSGEAVHLPRSGEPGSPDHPEFPKSAPSAAPPADKKKSAAK